MMMRSALIAAGLAGVAQGEAKCGTENGYQDVIHTFSREPFAPRLGSCAIVGSGGQLKGGHLGPEIDSHTTVIRVNRIPTSAYYDDLGKRTDIYFSNSITDTYPGGQTGMGVTMMEPNNPVGGKLWCQFQDVVIAANDARDGIQPPAPACPFGAAVVTRSSKYGSDRITPFKIPPDFDTVFPYGHTALPLEVFMWNARTMGDYYMSGGMKTFFTMAPLCDSLTMYGFKGSGNIDGHGTDSVHSFPTEHAWMHRIAQGNIIDTDFETPGDVKWMELNGITNHQEVLDRKNAVVEKLKEHLKCMASEGRIVVIGWTPGTPGAPVPAPAVQQKWEPFAAPNVAAPRGPPAFLTAGSPAAFALLAASALALAAGAKLAFSRAWHRDQLESATALKEDAELAPLDPEAAAPFASSSQ
eukprot:TRINITY_DN17155_c0_g1_i1.p1 TRINITY_DN17155_c0_g1~~TRINITY_DN17155_c0_g1_i1.p1  ORF type:complete len:412 (+),score=85.03 TRINITY_DN17155_c0_g1_i1:72-1307(+)